MRTPLSERFCGKVEIGRLNECWEWQAQINTYGYGVVRADNQKAQGAHREAYRLHYGDEIPEGMLIMHSCDNPACVNPLHLSIGTHKDNKADSCQKGRHTFGNSHGNRKLNEDQAKQIIADPRPKEEIAAEYGVTVRTVYYIKSGKLWRHLSI